MPIRQFPHRLESVKILTSRWEVATTESCGISKATLGRVPQYLEYVDSLPQDVEHISATRIAAELGLGEVQVRKDLAALCKKGRPRIGYDRTELRDSLRDFLTAQNDAAVIVGAGKLGKALLEYSGFDIYGIRMAAAFDTNVTDETELPSGKRILPIGMLEPFCRAHRVRIGVITTPAASAQTTLNRLCACGIRRIWCFAPCRLYTPADTIVQYEDLALSLAHLGQCGAKRA